MAFLYHPHHQDMLNKGMLSSLNRSYNDPEVIGLSWFHPAYSDGTLLASNDKQCQPELTLSVTTPGTCQCPQSLSDDSQQH